MKQEVLHLFDEEDVLLAHARLDDVPVDGKTELVFRNATISKTLKQLGGLFGNWIAFLSKNVHNESEDHIHRMLKARFLARIYIRMPVGDAQEQWVELLYFYQSNQMQVALEKHAKRISLSWATLAQTSEFMENIKNHYISEGHPLPEMEKNR